MGWQDARERGPFVAERDLEKLLDGYATGTLTEAERKALFEAALHDQALFGTLADEEALKELLDDPASRRRLLNALKGAGRAEDKVERWRALVPAWLHLPSVAKERDETVRIRYASSPASAPAPSASGPLRWAMAGGLAVIVLASVAVAWLYEEGSLTPEPVMTADSHGGGGSRPGTPPPVPQAPLRPPQSSAPAEPPLALSVRALFYAHAGAGMAGGSAPGEERTSQTAKPTPRLFSAAPTFPPLGLRYSLLKRSADGSEAEVDPGEVFNAEEVLRLTVEVNTPGYLYVFKRVPAGAWTLLFPPPRTRPDPAHRDALLDSGTRVVIPQTGSLTNPGEPGPAQLVLILSREPQGGVIKPAGGNANGHEGITAPAPELTTVVKRLRTEIAGGKLLIQRVDPTHPDIPDEHAVYVVDRGPVPASAVLADFMVSHR